MSTYVAGKNLAVLFFYLFCNAALCALYPFYIVFGVNLLLILSFVFSIKPAWGVYFLIFLVPISRDSIYFAFTGAWNFQINDAYTNLIPVFTPVFIFTCIGFLLHKGASLRMSTARNPANVLFLSMAVYAAFTLFWSDNLPHGLFQYCYLVSNIVLLGIVVSSAANEQTHRKIMWCLLLSCLLQAVLSYVFRFMETSIFEREFIGDVIVGVRNYGGLILSADGSPVQAHGLQEAHETSMLMNIFMGVAAGLFLTEKSRGKRVFLAFCFIAGLSVLIGTESRAGAAAFIAMGLFFLFFYQKTSKALVRSAVIFLAFALVFYVVEQKAFSALAGKEETVMRLLMLGQKAIDTGDVIDPGLSVKEGSGPGRRTIWGTGLSGLSGMWPVGLGIGNYKYHYKIPHAHSVPLSLFFDFGLIGLLLFASILYAIAKYYLNIVKLQHTYLQIMSLCLMSTLVAVVVQGCFDFDYTYPIIWLFGSILFSTLLLTNKPLV
ncbi:MAG: O-antigen ligase family protein [Nitrospirae bacterium]|nr:O-antigen ligase family protein [Nitrospirota bacterium]